jgi:valyl-tRNA synthetase
MSRGLDRFVARKKLWEDFEKMGLAIKKEARIQRVPRSQRGGEVSKERCHAHGAE